MELVQTGHSSNSWTLVAGAMAVGPVMVELLVALERDFEEEKSEWC